MPIVSHIRRSGASLVYGFRNQRGRYIWVGVTLLMSVILCFIPLFNLLAFEYCFALGVPLSLGAGILGAKRAPGPYEYGAGHTDWLTILAALLAAFIPICLNALRVDNCNILMGIGLFVIFPVVSTYVAWCWGAAIGTLLRRRATLTFIIVWFMTLVLAGLRFVLEPPVDLFNAFLGYWPGAIYDDLFLIDRRLIMSRLEDITMASGVLAASLTLKACYLSRVSKTALVSLLIIVVVSQHQLARHEGVYRDATFIQESLGGQHSTEHFDIYYPEGWSEHRARLLGIELEFAHHRLSSFFKEAPKRRITAYLYSDMDQKKALMGARRTRIAKPWQWAFHIHAPRIGQDVIVHEMAHVFAAPLGKSPHHLSLGPYGVPNMGIIEGVAEAATWPQGQLDLHQWSAAMHQLDIAPPIAELLTPTQFYGHHSRTAYTLCGSFSRFVHEDEGESILWKAYETGTFDSHQDETRQREARWRRFLDTVHVPERALAEARAKFDRPSIFGRVCAREMAQLWTDYGHAMKRKDPTGAIAVLQEILTHIPKSLRARQSLARLYMSQGNLDEAQSLAQGIVDGKGSGGVARSRARETLGDIAGLRGETVEARRIYQDLDDEVFSRHRRRSLAVKAEALDHGEAGKLILHTLSTPTPTGVRFKNLQKAYALDPTWSMVQYLMGRMLMSKKKWTKAIQALRTADAQVSSIDIRLEIQRLIAATAFHNACYSQAGKLYDQLAKRTDFELMPNEVRGLEIWRERSLFFGASTAKSDVECPVEIDKMLRGIEDSP